MKRFICGRENCSQNRFTCPFNEDTCPAYKRTIQTVDEPTKRNKYQAEKVTIDGITFDSRKEARLWYELKLLERAGEISELKRQVKYELIPAQKDGNGKCLEKAVSYIADFVWKDKDGKTIVADCKGYKQGGAYALFKVKRKLMLYMHEIRIREI